MAVFGFESICVLSEQLKDTNTTTSIGTHKPISVSISSSLIDEPVFLCDKNPKALNILFVEYIEDIANKSKTEMGIKFSSIETIIRARVNAICKNLSKRKYQKASAFECDDERTEEDDESDISTQFLQMQKNQILDSLFGFNSGKYDLNLIKSYLIHERDIQPTVFEKANYFVSLKFGDVHFLDILNSLGGDTSLDSFLKAYKTSETKGFFPYE